MNLAQIMAGLALMAAAQGAIAGDAEEMRKVLAEHIPGAGIDISARDNDSERIRKSLAEKMPEVKIGAITRTPYGGMYEVVVNGINIFYTDEKGETGFFGNLMDLKTQKNLTQQRVAQLRTIDFYSLPLDKAITRIKGDGSRKLALFSDPDCPYCQELEKELQDLNNVTIYTFLLPLTQLHPDAARKAEMAWCDKNPARAWEDMMLNGREPRGQTPCVAPLGEIAGLASKLGIVGTPGIIFESGRLVPGALARQQIEQLLSPSIANP